MLKSALQGLSCTVAASTASGGAYHFVARQEVRPVQRDKDLGMRQVLLRLDERLEAVADALGHEGRRDRDVLKIPTFQMVTLCRGPMYS